MTLLELLVQELPKRGGWPEKAHKLKQTATKRIIDDVDSEYFHFPNLDLLVSSERVKFVTREQYESALAASKTPWDGVGLPPVGCECEYVGNDASWGVVKVIGYDGDKVVFKPSGDTYYAIKPSNKCEFRSLSTEEDKKRDAAIESLMRIVCGPSQISATVNRLYDAIAAGKIPGVKLED